MSGGKPRGISLVEAVVAVAFFSIIAAALINLVSGTYLGTKSIFTHQRALNYAEEGLEAAKSIRNQAWNNLASGSYGLSANNGHWQFSGSDELLDNFYTRKIIIKDVYRDGSGNIVLPTAPGANLDLHTKKIISSVSWPAPAGAANQINLPFFVSSWQTKNFIQTDWRGGPSQTIWSDPAKFFSDDGNIDYSGSGEIKLRQVSPGGGNASYSWHFDNPADYNYDSNKIEVVGSQAQLINQTKVYSGQTTNSDFSYDTFGWSFFPWDVGSGEVTPLGNWGNLNGNPGGFAKIVIPADARGDTVGGYWQQAINISQASPDNVTCIFDRRVTNFTAPNGAVRSFRFYVFFDSSPGTPVMGQEIWRSVNFSASNNWASKTINCTNKVVAAGTYYYKIAVYIQVNNNPSGPVGPVVGGYDNAQVSWTKTVTGYPTDSPSINPIIPFNSNSVSAWTGFSEVATKNNGEIYYQLSSDDGTNWYYWSGSSWTLAGSANYNTATQINSNISSFPAATKKIMFKAFLASTGQQISLDEVAVSYKIVPSAASSWGNKFLINALDSSINLDSTAKKESFRFTAQQTKSVSALKIYVNSLFSSPTYRFGLQADDGNGNPSGTYLGYGDLKPFSAGWQTINLNPNISFIKGQTYHLVVSWQSDTIDSSHYINLRASSPLNNLIPYDQIFDPQANVLLSDNNGSSWQIMSLQPIYHLTYSDNTYEGNPFDSVNSATLYENYFYGQYLTFSEEIKFSEVSFYIRKIGNQPADNLNLTITNLTDNIQILSATLARKQDVGDSYTWFTYNFPQEITFAKNKNYRIYLFSPKSNSNSYYLAGVASTTNQAVLKETTFLGLNSYLQYSFNGGTSWLTLDNSDINFFFGQSGLSYAPQGELISSAFNAGNPAAFDFISWQEIIPTPATDILVQLSTAPAVGGLPGAWGPWLGPTGATSYYQAGQESLIPLVNNHNDNQFVRYKVILKSDGSDTPILQEIKINYTP